MTTIRSEDRPWERLLELVDRGDAAGLAGELEELGAQETARALGRLDEDGRRRLLQVLDAPQAAQVLDGLVDAQRAELLGLLEGSEAAPIVAELDSDERADLLGAMDRDSAAALLEAMPPKDRAATEKLALFGAFVGGGLMATEYLAFRDDMTVETVVAGLRRKANELGDDAIQYVYVEGENGRLVGVLPLRKLLVTEGRRAISSIMIRDPITVSVDADLDTLATFFDKHGFLSVPAVDSAGRIAGVVHRDAVEAALGDRAESDHLKSQGIVGGEELRSMPLMRRSSRRLAWLSVNILLNVAAASVIAAHQDTLAAVISLAVFLPMISDMSGCSGNQAVAVSMRELSLGLVKPFEMLYVWTKEIGVGLVNGAVLGVLIGAVAYLWKGSPWLGLVVGGALAANTVVAVSIGGVVPLLLKRLGLDPALASGPILTTCTDMAGFFFALTFAGMALDKLVTP